ncbi:MULTISPECIES: hypothetical protein [Pseudomonas putida group]|uniref:hypothetical protein n=1 Tax=Pseudomonas putida group TaxID=136845 RepID=UPI001E43E5F4|nr:MULTISPECIES: hypothetical protein [Pseudomonas putida group]MCE0990302.1 hypothetical protein [Pseudomonas alloputida]
MPTEKRSSNTEMVSVPEGYMLVERSIWTEQQVEAATACITRLKGVHGMRDRDLAMAAIDAAQCKAPDIALADLLPAPQPHPEPIAWMVGTDIWWTKEEAERNAAEVGLPVVGLGPMTQSSAPLVSMPDGYCLMPRQLTAENGAKALLLGEFRLEVTRECPECLELDEPAEGCEICDGEGEYAQRHTIPWDKIKFIYSEAVKGLALQPHAIL